MFVVLLVAALMAMPTAAPALPLRPESATGPLGNERLSDEFLLTRTVLANSPARIRRHPSSSSGIITRLRYDTEDGYPEVYLALRSYVDGRGATWIRIRIPARPNGRTGWVKQVSVGNMRTVHTALRIQRGRRATLYRRGRAVFSAPVGTGAPGTPTPAGQFWIREKFRAHGGIYGPYAFGTAAYSVLSDWPRGGVVGIHGTNQPGLIPGYPSHGCVRLRNSDITRLYRLMPVGTPVRIT